MLEEQGKKPKKEKKFKLPFGVKGSAKRKAKKGFVTVQILDENGEVDFKVMPVDQALIYLQQTKNWHLADVTNSWRYKKLPLVIMPKWDMAPITVKRLKEETDKTQTFADCQKAILLKAKSGDVKPKKGGMGGKALLLLIVGVIIVLYFVMQIVKGG